MEWFLYNLVILIQLYKIRYLNLDNALLFPINQVICLKNWKLWRATTTTRKFNIFGLNFAHVSYLTMFTKECSGFFFFCFDLELLIKMQKLSVWKPGLSGVWAQDLGGVGVSRGPLGGRFRWEVMGSMVVGARRGFLFFGLGAWFLGGSGALSGLLYWVLYCLIGIIKS